MDPKRAEAYLRAACSVLKFDIGEFWTATNGSITFRQLYTGQNYKEEQKLLLVRPSVDENAKEGNHKFSPVICKSVCDGGQIIWANSRMLEGLTGRSELPLKAAGELVIEGYFSIFRKSFFMWSGALDS